MVIDVATAAGVMLAQQLLAGPMTMPAADAADAAATGVGGDSELAAALKGGTLLLNNMHQVGWVGGGGEGAGGRGGGVAALKGGNCLSI